MTFGFRVSLIQGNRLGFKGFGIAPSEHSKEVRFTFEGEEFKLSHGDVVIAAITSCTNTSNPSVMLGAGVWFFFSFPPCLFFFFDLLGVFL